MNAQHERNLHLRRRLRPHVTEAQLEVPWRTYGILAQLVFFVLTCIAIGGFYAFNEGLITGIASIVLAEYLIGARRWFFTGVEAALWGGGLLALISELPRSGTPESMLVLAAAAAIAGARVRNPLYGAVSAIFVMLWFEERFDVGTLAALLIALGACLTLLRTWRRPTTEALWIAIALVMPIAGRLVADAAWRDVTIVLYAVFGLIAIGLAVAKRHHAMFFAAIIAFAIAARDFGEKIPTPLEAKFALAGALLLALTFAISRLLRGHTRGFVLTPIGLTPVDDLAEIGATVTFQPATHAPEPRPSTGGGSFGGAGASGDY
ncbi:MAG TPA: hypothetical protein VEK79_12910 [Thermoanaerobaculia bacterium]|nr:hypothetical protein [Thermoanaerobaculia bacterium]